MENKRLYRSLRDKKFAGVCGGIADYFNIDPILVRVVFVILALFGGGGVLAYLVLWVIVPVNPEPWFQNMDFKGTPGAEETPSGTENGACSPWSHEKDANKPARGALMGGLVLITLGVLFLLDRLLPNINFQDFWPVILIVIGLALIGGNFVLPKKNDNEL